MADGGMEPDRHPSRSDRELYIDRHDARRAYFSPIADQYGRKKVLGFCIFLFSLFTAAAGLIDSPLLFTIMRFLAALGMGGLMPNAISLMTEYSPKKTER